VEMDGGCCEQGMLDGGEQGKLAGHGRGGSIARLFVEAEGGTAAGETGYVWRHGVRDKVKVYTAVQCKDEAETGSSGQARLCTVAQHKGQSKSMHDGAV